MIQSLCSNCCSDYQDLHTWCGWCHLCCRGDWTLGVSSERDSSFRLLISKISCAEVNLGIICSCLPILPLFYKHVIKIARTKVFKSSKYSELQPVWRSGTGVERALPNNTKQSLGRAANEPALHQQYLELNEDHRQGSPFSMCSGAACHDPDADFWSGDGIMKTVRLDRVEESMVSDSTSILQIPQNAVLPSKPLKASDSLPEKRSWNQSLRPTISIQFTNRELLQTGALSLRAQRVSMRCFIVLMFRQQIILKSRAYVPESIWAFCSFFGSKVFPLASYRE